MVVIGTGPETSKPMLESISDAHARVEAMVEWFHANYADPADDLTWDNDEGDYQYLWGGPYDAGAVLAEAFPDADEQEISGAAHSIEAHGTVSWSVSSARLVLSEGLDDYDGSVRRRAASTLDPHRDSIVQTTLLPRRNFDWAIDVTFIPAHTNADLSQIFYSARDVASYGRDDYHFESLRHLVSTLVGHGLGGSVVGSNKSGEAADEWVRSLRSDADLFVDDAVVVHHSPPEWLSLRKLFEHGGASGIAMISQEPGHWTGVLLMYGGSLLFLRCVSGLNFVQQAFFERWAKRISEDRNNPL